jgi:hypothetical protein
VVINYAGLCNQAMVVGTFINRDEALREAQLLSKRMEVPVEEIS